MIEAHEHAHELRFDIVMRVRLDLYWEEVLQMPQLFQAGEVHVPHMSKCVPCTTMHSQAVDGRAIGRASRPFTIHSRRAWAGVTDTTTSSPLVSARRWLHI